MSVDSTIALVTVDEVKNFLGIDYELSTADQSRIEYLINAVSHQIEKYCDRKFITPSSDITEIFDGDGTADYYVKNIPIVGTIASSDISYRSGEGETWSETTATFNYDSSSGRVYFTDGNVFSTGKDNWRIVYSYGYSVSNVPVDLKIAAIELIAFRKKKFDDNVHGVSAVTYPDNTITYSFDKMPDSVLAMLNRYKRVI